MTNEIQQTRGKPKTLANLLLEQKSQIEAALPSHLPIDRMFRVILTAFRTTPKLAQCTPASFMGSVMTAAQLGLEPNTPLGHCYLIPRKSKGSMECTLMLGYQGMIELARRSGKVRRLHAYVVREGDEFEWELGLNPTIRHKPKDDNADAPITHAYACAKLEHGDDMFSVLTRAEIEKRRKRGASGRGISTPWDTDYDAMARKSAVRDLWSFLPKSAEMARAAQVDDEGERINAMAEALASSMRSGPALLADLNGDSNDDDAIDVDEAPEDEIPEVAQ